MFNAVSFQIFQALFHVTLNVFLVVYPFQNNFRVSKKKVVMISIAYVILVSIFSGIFFSENSPFNEYLTVVLFGLILVTIIIALCVIKSSPVQMFFIVFVIFNMRYNLSLLASMIHDSKLFPCFSNARVEIDLIALILAFLTFPLLWYLINHLFRKVIEYKIDFSYWKIITLLPMSHFALLLNSTSTSSMYLSRLSWNRLTTLLLLDITIYFSYVIALKMLLQTYGQKISTEKLKMTERQLMMQRNQYEDLTESIRASRRVHHDWRQQLIYLRGFVEAGDLNGLDEYLNKYISNNQFKESVILCENQSVDIIVRHYLSLAKELEITMNVALNLPKVLNIDESDLCVVFGNLIENALESCMKQNNETCFIDVKAKQASDSLIAISIKNSYEGEVKKHHGEFISTKHEGMGIGISSVELIAEKYNGYCKITFDDHVFTVNVLLEFKKIG